VVAGVTEIVFAEEAKELLEVRTRERLGRRHHEGQAVATRAVDGHDVEDKCRVEGDHDAIPDCLHRRVEDMAHEVVAVIGQLERAAAQDRRRGV
jgi:hypothetical protein